MKSLRRLIDSGFIFGTLFFLEQNGEQLFDRVGFRTVYRLQPWLRFVAYDIMFTPSKVMCYNQGPSV